MATREIILKYLLEHKSATMPDLMCATGKSKREVYKSITRLRKNIQIWSVGRSDIEYELAGKVTDLT